MKESNKKNPNPQQIMEYWEYAIGLQKVDNLEPSDYLLQLTKKHINGDTTINELINDLNEYYYSKREISPEQMECDLVSARIVGALEEFKFTFSLSNLLAIHKYLFQDMYKHAGRIRQVNLEKDEPVLLGSTVQYGSYHNLREMLEYDFETQKTKIIKNMSKQDVCNIMTTFLSNVWQAHPFQEGNTRTCAIFIEKYLDSLGITTKKELFKENSKYFRNCLVRANYSSRVYHIESEDKYLLNFMGALLELEEFNKAELTIVKS